MISTSRISIPNHGIVHWKSETSLVTSSPSALKDANKSTRIKSTNEKNPLHSTTTLPSFLVSSGRSDSISNLTTQIEALLKDAAPQKIEEILLDRLHYMETLATIQSEVKRKRVSRDTIDVFSTLAAKTGFHQIKDSLEDLAFYYLDPEARAQILQKMNSYCSEKKDIASLILEELQEVLIENGITNFYILGRVKSPFSIWQKMDRKNLKFEQIRDIFAFRVIVGSIAECYQCLHILHKSFLPISGRFKDYIRLTKDENYKALHTSVVGPFQKSIEIQIRTEQMNELAKESWIKYWRQKTQSY